MSAAPTQSTSSAGYRERLVPGPGIFIALLLLIPAVALVLTPVNAQIAIPTAVIAYAVVAAAMLLLSPTIAVADGFLTADRARIPVDQLGEIELLGTDALRAAIGPGLDARSFLLIRGWIKRGVRIQNIDPADPAPVWIITTRHPRALADAIEAARTE
ncbi:DUF3093 domain-containing protein [Leucobacter massiliensis]|uniref:DUF3093 domain-containing protein n=1 Tax=Leucobacter massiliensis TaxID=1686285 RepID=A0A2S9QRT7_9MICO|nr:DUF3093 domain-containing protein [Leucobacter massiliensis]PRI12282.1 hypothetical protein B4915_03585 [Leucobacter massiliensis]